eukprot:m.206714 g.206714  ORF g.206714 m.206714 type:complete len:669 (-) comp32964_c0_seq1:31-2037(-)
MGKRSLHTSSTSDDETSSTPTQPQPQPQQTKTVSKFGMVISGGSAGIISRSVTAPVDRVRILYQVNAHRSFTIQNALKSLRTIHQNTGIWGLWRGNGAAVLRTAPYQGAAFTSFEIYRKYLEKHSPIESSVATRFMAGGLAGATATTLTYPLDLVRARMAAHWSMTPRYSGMFSGMREIVQKEGFLALYSGINPTLIGIVPYAGISFGIFETLKSTSQRWLELDSANDIPTPVRLACGGFAGLVAQTTTYPLHVVRRRMQVHEKNLTTGEKIYAVNSKNINFTSVWATLRNIYITEGKAGLFKGVTLTYVKAPIAVALSFTINDSIKQYLTEHPLEDTGDTFWERVPNLNRTSAPLPMVPPHNGQMQPRQETTVEIHFFEKFAAGGIAGACAKSMIAPADRVKIIYQVNPHLKFSFSEAIGTAREIVQTKGFSGLWRGHTATLLRVFPYAAITFTSYDKYEELFSSSSVFGSSSIVSRFFAGAAAGATAHTFTYPLDLMRARLAADCVVTPVYDGYMSMFQSIVKTEGITAIFNGLKPTLIGIIPYAGLSFASFETLKYQARETWNMQEDEIPVTIRLVLGGTSALFAQSATYPLDSIRRRMQVDSANEYRGMRDCFETIVRNEGWRALYKGLSMNWIKGPVGVAVSFAVNDSVKAKFRESKRSAAVL